MKPRITLLLGTGRDHRQSEKVAQYIASHLEQRSDIALSFHDVREYAQPKTFEEWNEHEETKAWKAVVAKSDAFLIVAPEYNWSFPGELKTVLDQDLAGYLGKPALVVGVGGRFAGARMITSLNVVLFELGLVHIPYPLNFNASEIKEMTEAQFRETHGRRIDNAMEKLLIYTKYLAGIGDLLRS